ncbi:helix-turn-helix domain-containing protein [Nocardioides speluncae]|uniref:helix-turn-helix domain-containing protein n=1 Tax=Nocardioides speluncae TaxID=2670337 RepID=UPI000D693063|nr:helix-turn-helix domain-containing protein [Nocardioides speluncae]
MRTYEADSTPPVQLLQALGLSPAAATVYLRLVTGVSESVEDLQESVSLDEATVVGAVGDLLTMGLVQMIGDLVAAYPPRPALESMAERRAREASLARESAEALARVWNAHVDAPAYVELLTTTAAVQEASERIMDEAEKEILGLSHGPLGDADLEPEVADGLLDALARGVSIRAVYGAQILKNPAGLRAMQICIDHGEQARVFPDIPLNLVIGDRFLIMVTSADGPERLHGLLVHRSPLYDALHALFESLWTMSVSLPTALTADRGKDQITEDSRQLLVMLSVGLTDESIARELGVSERTVARRVARLQEMLGAQSRFQLGAQATRHGWL